MLDAPATFVACAPLQGRAAGADDRRGRASQALPITWITGLESLAVAAAADAAGESIALELEPSWFGSKQSLRDAIAVARAALPALDAAVIQGAVPRHHDVLAAAGIRVVAVEALAPVPRGNRRPAPQGWACRNVAWGLWEVLIGTTPRPNLSWLAWAGLGSRPAAGSLHVHRVADGSSRSNRWLAWAARHVARGGEAATLAELPALIEGGRDAGLTGSILKAA
jgi:hypothetical protein